MLTKQSEGSVPQGIDAQGLQGDPRWVVAERAARSQAFSRATQLRSILLYLVRQAILQPDHSIHESDIAHRVLGRRDDFNPLDDNIVRVQMTRLRKRLDSYFSMEGKDEEIVIAISPGSYKPFFCNCIKPAPDPVPVNEDSPKDSGLSANQEEAAVLSAVAEIPEKTQRGTSRLLLTAVTSLLALLLGIMGGYYLRPREVLGQQPAAISNPVLRQIFAPGAVVNVVLSDDSLVLIQDVVHSDISVAEYLNPSYPENLLAKTADLALISTLKAVAHHSLTSLNNADVAGQCFRWATLSGSKVYIRYARYMHTRDFEQGDFVIVGSRRSNPWTTLFERRLNFYLEEDIATHTFHFRNREPKPGEPQTYAAQYEGVGNHIGYVDIAMLPNLAGTGTVLLFNGLRMEDDDAASNAIFARDMPASLIHALASASSASTTEVLLRVRSVGGAENGWEIVSVHSSNH